jgi:hypothetical protein
MDKTGMTFIGICLIMMAVFAVAGIFVIPNL